MSIRVYLDPAKIEIVRDGSSSYGTVLIKELEIDLQFDRGMPFIDFYHDPNPLIHPLLEERILQVTILDVVTDPDHIGILKSGDYEIGDVFGRVTLFHELSEVGRGVVGAKIFLRGKTVAATTRAMTLLLRGQIEPTYPFSPMQERDASDELLYDQEDDNNR